MAVLKLRDRLLPHIAHLVSHPLNLEMKQRKAAHRTDQTPSRAQSRRIRSIEEYSMSNGKDSGSYQESVGETRRFARLPVMPDPLSSEDIDAQIRWFFENTPERKPLHP